MKWVKMVETFDGVRHNDCRAAQKHLDKLYGDQLAQIAHELGRLDGKYFKFTEYLGNAENQEKIIHLATIRKDMELPREEDE